MGYRLYTRPGSGGFVVEVAFAMAGVPVEKIDVTRAEQKPGGTFREINPVGQVPALILPDGRLMTESAAICLYLAEQYPLRGIGPVAGSSERPDFLRWMLFLASAHYPTLLRFYYPDRRTTDAGGIDAVKQAAVAESEQLFEVVENHLAGRQWLVGDTMTIADVYLAMLAYWLPPDDRPRAVWTNIIALSNRVARDATVAELNKTHKIW
ncbi:MAG TPA: glutathione S-transferase family protein [Rhizobiaceae bacterium]|nr:glutathione S-transferase family protein [Rhizobiaceae bacterium]